jgi:hypothetical protein
MNPVVVAGQINRQIGQSGAGPSFAGRGGGGGFGGFSQVIPGDYTVKMSYNGSTTSSKITVRSDPRTPAPDTYIMKENLKRADPIIKRIRELNEAYQNYYECNQLITKVENLTSGSKEFSESVKDFHPQLKAKYDGLERRLSGRPDGLFNTINRFRLLMTATSTLSEEEERTLNNSVTSIEEAIKLINDFISDDWPLYKKNLSSKQVPADALINL